MRWVPLYPADNICFRPKMAESTLNDSFWARSRLITKAKATGNTRATLPLETSLEGREAGDQFGHPPHCRNAGDVAAKHSAKNTTPLTTSHRHGTG